MDLLTYVKCMQTRRELAAALDTSPDYLWQIGKGIRQASPQMATAIHNATAGRIKRSDLRPDLWGRK